MKFSAYTLAAIIALVSGSAIALEERTLILKDHKFTPETLTIAAGERLKLTVDNQDATAAEFESDDFKREKIIAGNSKATIYVLPLEVGEYKFFDEFNEDTAQGTLIVEDPLAAKVEASKAVDAAKTLSAEANQSVNAAKAKITAPTITAE